MVVLILCVGCFFSKWMYLEELIRLRFVLDE